MRSAAVGHQCVDCVQQGAATVRDPRTRFGGRDRAGAPVVTYVLIALNVLAFMAESASIEVQRQLSLWPPGVAVYGQLYRLVTSAFMHYGPAHLLLNMWALYVVGPPLEMWLGRLRFSALYALSGLGGSVLVYLISPLNSATAGRRAHCSACSRQRSWSPSGSLWTSAGWSPSSSSTSPSLSSYR